MATRKEIIIANAFALPTLATAISDIIGQHMKRKTRAEDHMPGFPAPIDNMKRPALPPEEFSRRVYEILADSPSTCPAICAELASGRERVIGALDRMIYAGHVHKWLQHTEHITRHGGHPTAFYRLTEAGQEYMEGRAA